MRIVNDNTPYEPTITRTTGYNHIGDFPPYKYIGDLPPYKYIGDFPPPQAPQGWQCPICGRVYSPTTPMCWYCGNQKITYTTDGTNIKENE